jgi:hypothetical protein
MKSETYQDRSPISPSRWVVFLFTAMLAATGCGDAGASGDAAGSTSATAPLVTDLSPRDVCALLLTCMEQSSAPIVDSYGAFAAQYGPTGTCWQDDLAAAWCGLTCIGELAKQGCNFCQSDVPCDGTLGLACDETTHTCSR